MGDPQENHVIFQLIHGLMTWMIWGYIYIYTYIWETYSEYEIMWENILIIELDFYIWDWYCGMKFVSNDLMVQNNVVLGWGWWICGDGQQDLRRTCCFVLRICTGPNSVTVWFQVLLGNPSSRKAILNVFFIVFLLSFKLLPNKWGVADVLAG